MNVHRWFLVFVLIVEALISLGWKMCLFNCAISFVLLGLSSIVLKKLTENV